MMERIKSVSIMAGFVLVVSVLAFSPVYASSCNQDSDQKSGGQGKFDRPFSDMDADGNGSLSYTEFKAVFPSTEQQGFDTLDTDKNGSLSREEWHQFKAMHQGMGGMRHKKRYHDKALPEPSKFNAHFPDMDTDHNDQVTREEFIAYFADISDNEAVFNAIDLDENGYLNHDEWHEFKSAHELKHMD
ncbi:MAG: EF-hand domain-containing protein [Desulfotignum sp.]|nr:EF-hand domain-containing protein [Desulfotignum sp.]MCF8138552.1 EF-hand domain-containing protein [Desulfotignum sp.]